MTLEEQIRPHLDRYAERKLREKPNNSINRIPLEKNPNHLDFEETIGVTTYIVKSFFDSDTEEDIFRKVIRLMNDSKINKAE